MSTNKELIAEARADHRQSGTGQFSSQECAGCGEYWPCEITQFADALEALLPKEPTFSQRHEAMKAISRPFRRSPSDGLIETWESAAVNALIEAGWRPRLTPSKNGEGS